MWFPYRFVHSVYVFGTQTRSCDKPFQHPLFHFHHLRFLFLSIETIFIIITISSCTWAIEEIVSIASGVRVERKYIAKLHRNGERQSGM
jgi:hypothetical protein